MNTNKCLELIYIKLSPFLTLLIAGNVTWLVGSSMIYWGQKRAEETRLQRAVESQTQWFGTRGMCWNQLMGRMMGLLANSPPPNKLIIHLGGNDLGKVPIGSLFYNIRNDLRKLAKMMPQTKIGWSDLTARRRYRHAKQHSKVENARKALNRKAHKTVSEIGVFFIEHRAIQWDKTELFRSDGVHMSDEGNDILLSNWFAK